MASASTFPPSHVGTHSFHHDAGEPDAMEFPQLTPASDVNNNISISNDVNAKRETDDDSWEMVPDQEAKNDKPSASASSPQVKFQLTQDQSRREEQQQEQAKPTAKVNPKQLLHSQSSPNLRDYTIEESDSDEEDYEKVESHTTSQDDAASTTTNNSSNFSMVSSAPSVNSIWSSRISFKDALMKKDAPAIPENDATSQAPPKKQHGQHIKKIKPKFIVTEVAPLKHAKSMGDLSQLTDEDLDILGETDANEYYSRKAQGSLGRRNGRKQRPDEAKRLQITMNKKNLQRARQGH